MPKTRLCRLCLADLSDNQLFYSLINEGLVEIIESFTPIRFYYEDHYSTVCCPKCLEEVNFVAKIRDKIIESDRFFHNESTDDRKRRKEEMNEIETGHEDDERQITAIMEPEVQITINPEINKTLRKQIENKRQNCAKNNLTVCPKKEKKSRGKDAKPKACETCGLVILSCNYSRHIETHETNTDQICDICGAIAKNAGSLRGHMFYMHRSAPDKYKCNDCCKMFRYKYKFELHMRRYHNGGEPTQYCEVCAKAFYTVAAVRKHIQMTHLKLRPFVCEYCHKGFSSSNAKKTHLRQHTNEKPFKCDVCAEGFRQKVSLKTHLRSKHGMILNYDTIEFSQQN